MYNRVVLNNNTCTVAMCCFLSEYGLNCCWGPLRLWRWCSAISNCSDLKCLRVIDQHFSYGEVSIRRDFLCLNVTIKWNGRKTMIFLSLSRKYWLCLMSDICRLSNSVFSIIRQISKGNTLQIIWKVWIFAINTSNGIKSKESEKISVTVNAWNTHSPTVLTGLQTWTIHPADLLSRL